MIEFQRVTVMRGTRPGLDDVSLRIPKGESVAILGPNGCGKSTLIGTILREFYPLRLPGAHVKILGSELWNVDDLRAQIGIVKNNLLPPKTGSVSVRDLVVSSFFGSVGLWNYQQPTAAMLEATAEALVRVGAEYLADRDVDELSSGEARRAEIARALVHRPHTLLLDEPMNHLDPRAQTEFRDLLQSLAQAGIALILVTHHISDIVPEIRRVLMLRDGKLFAEGATDHLINGPVLSELFRCPLVVQRARNTWFATGA